MCAHMQFSLNLLSYLPTVPERPEQSRIYCSFHLAHTQDAIYLECPGKSGHQLPRPSAFRKQARPSSFMI